MDKKFTSLIIGLLCCVWQLSAQQTPTFSITPHTTNAEVGDVIEFSVEVSNFSNIATFQYGINWDPAVLEFIEITSINTDASTGFPGLSNPANGNGTFSVPGGNVPAGQLGVAWFNPSFTGLTRADGTVIFTFTVRAKSGGSTDLVFAAAPLPKIEVLTGDFVDVGLMQDEQGTTVTVAGGSVPEVSFSIGSGTILEGEQQCINVSVSGFANIASAQLSIDYNATILQFASVQGMNLSGLDQSSFDTSTPGKATLNWSSASGVTVADGTVIFQLCFNGLQAGSSALSFSGTTVEDGNGGSVNFNGQNGSITVNPVSTGGDFLIDIEDRNVQDGDQFCLKLTAQNFNDVVGMAFTLNYDPSQLSFQSVTNLNPDIPGFSAAANIGTPNSGLNPGFVTVNYFNLDLSGVNLPNGAVLFEICFTAIGNGATEIQFSSDIAQIEVTDSNQEIIPFNGNPGNVNIEGDGPPPPPPPTDDFRLTIEDIDIDPNDQFCVKVTADNFTDVVGMQFTINYDPGLLSFDQATNLNPDVPMFSVAANIGTPNSGLNPGFVTVNYFNQDLTGVSLPNGAVLFELCFTEIGGSGAESDIVFSGDIAQIEISDSNEDIIPFTSEEGTVSVSGIFQGFRLTIEDRNVAPAEEFCLQVTAENFTDILSMSYTINYDPNEMEFMQVSNLNPNIPGFTVDGSFGTPNSGLSPGFISLLYFNLDLEPVSLPNNAVLFEICFRARGLEGTCSDLFFSSDVATIDVIDGNEQTVDFNSRRGTVCVDSSIPGQVSLTAGNATVDPDDNFCIPVRVRNFDDIQNMSFTVSYDPGKLEFANLGSINGNVPGLSASISTPASGTPSGVVTVNWSSQAGVTLADNTVLFELCFRAIGTDGTCSDVSFNGTVEPVEFRNTSDEVLPFNAVEGTVCINPAFDGFLLTIQDKMVEPLEQFCVPVTVLNFEDVVGLQFTINYDASQLQFQQATNLNPNLPLFTVESNISGPPELQDGFITMVWFEQSLQPLALPNGAVLFELCFAAIGEDGQSSDITFSGDVAQIEISDSNQEIIPFNGEEGTITISSVQPPGIGNAMITDVDCFGGADGAISITANGGTGGPYSYNWSNGATGNQVSGLAAGSYSVTVTDQNSQLTATASYTVSQPGSAITIVGNTDPPSCVGGSNGSLTLSATGGTPGYTYDWDSGLQDGLTTHTNLSAGTYRVTVTDSKGCTATRSFSVPEGTGQISLSAAVENVSCLGSSDGSIQLNVAGAQEPLNYLWSPNANSSGVSATNLDGGQYSVTVIDDIGCTAQQQFTIDEPPAVLQLSDFTATLIDDGGDGSITANAGGGYMPYSYSWEGPNGTTFDSRQLSGLDNPGQYCVTVTDNGGCTVTGCYELVRRLKFEEVSITDACYDENNGAITVNVSGGKSPYGYEWSQGTSSGPSLPNIDGGIYFLTVTDSEGEEITGEFEVTESPQFIFDFGFMPVTENASNTNGQIALNVSGGIGNLQYEWDNGATTSTVSNLGTGTYCVTVTDENQCASDTCFNIFYAAPFMPPAITAASTSCWNTEDGSVTVEIQGGLPPYTINITDGAGNQLPPIVTSDDIISQDNLPPGSTQIIITDDLGETQSVTVPIESPSEINSALQRLRHDNEEDGCSGRIELAINGGTPGYTVSWTNTSQTGTVLENLCGDDTVYRATITDANGCTVAMDSFQINTFRVDVANIIDTECPDDPTGAVQVDVSGGEPGYTFMWFNSAGNLILEAEDLTGFRAGDYKLVVSEPSGNTLTEEVTISSTSTLSVAPEITTNYNGFDVSCYNSNDGRIRANASGSENYSYEWTRNDVLLGTGPVLEQAGAGEYQLMVIDGSGCTFTEQLILEAPDTFRLQANIEDASCTGGKDGSIALSPSGGVQGFNYFYQWSNGAFSSRISFLAPGEYAVNVMDANNCTIDTTLTVASPKPLDIAFETEPATDGCNGSAKVIIDGGTEPFRFNWANVDGAGNEDFLINLCPGEYFLQVTDDNGCTSELASVQVDDRRFPCLEERVVITPDGNGSNDEFLIFCVGDFPDNHLAIYNRWGQLVFEADNYDNTWEGTTGDGQPLPEGPYYYVLEYTDPEGNLVQQKGSITILRGDE